MIHQDLLTDLFQINYRVIQRQTEGLTHDDSLLQLPFRGNCLNWVLGHIVATRNQMFALLDEAPIWSEAEATGYKTGSQPITSGEQAHPLEKILADFDLSQGRLIVALKRTSSQELDAIKGESPVGKQLASLHFHEAYHVGQTEILRQLAGTEDAVI